MSSAPTVVRSVTPEDAPALERFNARLAAGQITLQVTASVAALEKLVAPAPSFVYRRMLVAAQGEEVRAAMSLLHHRMWIGGEQRPFAWVMLPISEGMVNRAYSMAIIQLLRSALKETPWLLSLGVGSMEESWARIAVGLGWKQTSVPFFFHPVRINRVMGELRALRSKPLLHKGARIASTLGIGYLGSLGQSIRYRMLKGSPGVRSRMVREFAVDADEIFERHRAGYEIVADRSSTALNAIYPADDARFRRLMVTGRDGTPQGWVICGVSKMENNHHFGNMTIGVLVDGFGPPERAAALLAAGVDHLIDAKVDLIVSNWSHPAWIAGARKLGFLSGPSNYLLFAPPAAATELKIEKGMLTPIHLTRGDSDGMVSFRRGAIPARA